MTLTGCNFQAGFPQAGLFDRAVLLLTFDTIFSETGCELIDLTVSTANLLKVLVAENSVLLQRVIKECTPSV